MSRGTVTSRNETVLVVDDNRSLADGFARALTDDYEVVTAYSGREALESFDASVDAVLLDRHLPDVSGDELLDVFRDSDYDCRVAVISAADPSPELDCDVYVTKPISGVEVLRETVTDLLEGTVST